ncbi:MAG: hypothetical protein Q4B60_05625 [Erysipelotrichaceae bacterium]|nr:hypothetical protein [Erysipelotrichaceae bacterium]
MKKLFAMLLVAAMCFSLVACGGGNDTPSADNNNEQQNEQNNNEVDKKKTYNPVGTWKGFHPGPKTNVTLVFNENGTGTYEQEGDDAIYEFDWRDNGICLARGGESGYGVSICILGEALHWCGYRIVENENGQLQFGDFEIFKTE